MDDGRNELGRLLEEAGYAAVGFAVLGVQRAQVVRRQLERCSAATTTSACLRSLVDRLVGAPGSRGGDPPAGRSG